MQSMGNGWMPDEERLRIDRDTPFQLAEILLQDLENQFVFADIWVGKRMCHPRSPARCAFHAARRRACVHHGISTISPNRSTALIHNIRTAPQLRFIWAATDSKLRCSRCRSV